MPLITKESTRKSLPHFRNCLGPRRSSNIEPHNSRTTPFSPDADPLFRCSISPKRDLPTVSVSENGSMSTDSLSTTSDMGLAATSLVAPATVCTWGFIGGCDPVAAVGVVKVGWGWSYKSGRIGMRGPGAGAVECNSSMEGM